MPNDITKMAIQKLKDEIEITFPEIEVSFDWKHGGVSIRDGDHDMVSFYPGCDPEAILHAVLWGLKARAVIDRQRANC